MGGLLSCESACDLVRRAFLFQNIPVIFMILRKMHRGNIRKLVKLWLMNAKNCWDWKVFWRSWKEHNSKRKICHGNWKLKKPTYRLLMKHPHQNRSVLEIMVVCRHLVCIASGLNAGYSTFGVCLSTQFADIFYPQKYRQPFIHFINFLCEYNNMTPILLKSSPLPFSDITWNLFVIFSNHFINAVS